MCAVGQGLRRGRLIAMAATAIVVAWVARVAPAQIELPNPSPSDPVVAAAQMANRWTQGAYEVWLLRGGCRIDQGPDSACCREAVCWSDTTTSAS